MKSEILVKSTAQLEKEVTEQDVKCEDKSLSEILDGEEKLRRERVSGSDSEDNGKVEEQV